MSDSAPPNISEPATAPPAPAMAKTMQRAMMWSVLNVVFSQGAGFAIFLIIAAQLPPHIFGMVALAALAADVVAMDGRFAAMDAIIQAGRYDRRSLNSVFSTFFVLSATVAAAIWIAAPHVAAAFGEPMIATFMPLFGLMLLPVPWLAVMDALMMRDLHYKQATERSIGATLAGGAVGIAFAFSPLLIWALFAQRLTSLLVAAGLQYKFTRWLPAFQIDKSTGFDFLRRLSALWIITTLTQTISRVTLLVFGARYDLATVGLLRATNRISEAIQGPLISPLTGLWFPLMAKVKGDLAGEREVYNNILQTAAFVSLPTFAGLALVAGDVVSLILPAQYAGVTPILWATSITLLLVPVLWYNSVAMSAMGMNKPSLVYTVALVTSAIATLLAIPDATPTEAILIMAIPCALVGIGGNVVLNRRLEQTNLAHYDGLLPAILATLAMSAATFGAGSLMESWPPLPRLVVCVATGGIAYTGWLAVFHRRWLRQRIEMIRGRGR